MALGAMNLTFCRPLAHLPIGVAVTIEFIGPLTLAAVLSRRGADALAVVAAAVGIALISGALHLTGPPPLTGILLALAAGTSGRHISSRLADRRRLPGVDGSPSRCSWPPCSSALGRGDGGALERRDRSQGVAIAILSSVIPYCAGSSRCVS